MLTQVATPVHRRALASIPVFFIFFLLVVCYQYATNTWNSGYFAHPDEPAHYMSALMVRDYVLHGLASPPVSFAQDYYAHRPFVSIGHWPPFFYIALAFWMLIFGVSKVSTISFIAMVSAGTATGIYFVAKGHLSTLTAAAAAVLFLVSPIALQANRYLMTDGFIALFFLAAIVVLSRFFESTQFGYLAGFACIVSLASLSKFTAIPLFAMPWLGAVVLWRLDLLRNVRFWLISALTPVPAVLWAMQAAQYVQGGLLAKQASFYEQVYSFLAGAAITLGTALALALLATAFGALAVWKHLDTLSKLTLATTACHLVFIFLTPVPKNGRYLFTIAPLLILLLGSLCLSLSRKLHRGQLPAVVLTVLVAATGVQSLVLTVQKTDPLIPVVDFFRASSDRAARSMLVPGQIEGPFIASYFSKFHERSDDILLRPNKLFASMDWHGKAYQSLLDAEEVTASAILLRENVQFVVLLTSTHFHSLWPHLEQVTAAIRGDSNNWILRKSLPTELGEFLIFENRSYIPPATLSNSLRATILQRITARKSQVISESE